MVRGWGGRVGGEKVLFRVTVYAVVHYRASWYYYHVLYIVWYSRVKYSIVV